MSKLFMLSPAQMRRIEQYFPLSHGVPRVDDRRVISGIIFVIWRRHYNTIRSTAHWATDHRPQKAILPCPAAPAYATLQPAQQGI